MSEVRFYGIKSPFSNFSPLPITVDGLEYLTTEHFFQAMKFATSAPVNAEEIRKALTPGIAKRLGGSRKHPLVKDWDKKRIEVMRTALFCKAIQNPVFAKELLSTGTKDLIEASPRDYFWGEGRTKTGKNMLGVLLKELRARLKKNEDTYYRTD